MPITANSPVPAGSITAFTVTAPGSGYTSAPAVTITDLYGTGTGALATATINGSGHVIAVNIGNSGSGYRAPQVTIADPSPGPGLTATAQASVGGTLTGGMRKFVDGLPGLGSAGANNLGRYIPLRKS